ncbi:MAG: DNA polymerase Y family protein [Candidatus Dormibacteria bacterium]
MSWATRLACLCFPHLALVLAWRSHPELSQEAVLVGLPGSPRVLAASPSAQAAGASPGQEWRGAEIHCPKAVRLEADPEALAGLRRAARQALTDCSPLVEWGDDSQAYVDLSGSDPEGSPPGMRAANCGRRLRDRLGVAPQVGLGPSRFSAWVAAQRAQPGRVIAVPTGRAAEFLADWPVGRLPIAPDLAERLVQFGLRTAGDCAAVALADLQRQFGVEGLGLHRICLGRDPGTIDPWRQPPACGVRRSLAGGVEDLESLRFGASELAAGLAQELARQGRAAGRLRLLLLGDPERPPAGPPRRPAWWAEVAPAVAPATGAELLGPLLGLFGQAKLNFAVTEVVLEGLELITPPATQAELWQVGAAHREAVSQAVGRLHARFGLGLVWRVEVRPGHPGDVPSERLSWRSG